MDAGTPESKKGGQKEERESPTRNMQVDLESRIHACSNNRTSNHHVSAGKQEKLHGITCTVLCHYLLPLLSLLPLLALCNYRHYRVL